MICKSLDERPTLCEEISDSTITESITVFIGDHLDVELIIIVLLLLLVANGGLIFYYRTYVRKEMKLM